MTFDEIRDEGRRIARNDKDLAARLHSLAREENFAALIGWLELRHDQLTDQGASPTLAERHGTMAHNQGMVWALRALLAELRKIYEHPAKAREVPQRAD